MNTSQVKLIIFANCFIQPLVSGGDKRFIELARRWKEKTDLSIITPAVGLKVCQEMEQLDTNYQTLPCAWTDRLGIVGTYICRTIFAFFKIPKFKQDLIAYSSSDILPDIIPAFLMKLINKDTNWITSVFHLIPPPSKRPGSWLRNALSHYSQRLSIYFIKRWADIVFVTNSEVEEKLVNYFRFSRRKIRMTQMGIERGLIDSINSPEKCYEGAFLGRFVPSKGIFDLIEIWKLVVEKYPKTRLAVIGTGEEVMKEKLTELIRENSLDNNIELLGFLPKREVIQVLKSARVFLFPSWEEGWGLSIAEAMACGLPVIAYDLPVYKVIFNTGIIKVPLGDTERFANEVIYLLNDKKTLLKMSQDTLSQSSEYDWDMVAQKEFGILSNLLR